MSEEGFDSGYDFDPFTGATYHFEHIPQTEADERTEVASLPHVVETINYSLAEDGSQHLNEYYAESFADAVSLASRLQFLFTDGEVAEEVVAIRPASPEEADELHERHAKFLDSMPEAVPDKKGGKK